jgi:predicted small secreted protein
MMSFEQLKSDNDLKEVIKTAFDADLAVSGSWGYTQELATVIESTEVPLAQLEHMLASMRSYIEMNMTLPKEDRYGSINLNETQREQIKVGDLVYDKVTYEITAMKEDLYTAFINEYKEGLGTEGFDITEHFNQRKKATISRSEAYWFEVHQTL